MSAQVMIERSEAGEPALARGGGPRAGGAVRTRLLTVALLVAVMLSLVFALPGLSNVASLIGRVGEGWLVLALALELASCASFVVIFRYFFASVPARSARELAWTEMGSGALLPGGGVGSLAIGGWLLHLAGMPTRQIVRSSSGVFFLTSAVNVAALIAGGLMLATGLSAGAQQLALAWVPILAGLAAIVLVIIVARGGERNSGEGESGWSGQLVGGISEAERVLRHPSWRLAGALGYLGFDIAVLWATLSGVGYSPPVAVLVLGYLIGYLANLIPIPGAIGVLEGGLAGTLILYGAPPAQAAAAVLIYHAIAFWIPSTGGLIAYRRLRAHLPAAEDREAARPRARLRDELDAGPPPHQRVTSRGLSRAPGRASCGQAVRRSTSSRPADRRS